MKSLRRFMTALLVLVSLYSGTHAIAGQAEVDKVEASTAILNEIMNIPEKAIPPSLWGNSQGIVVIPSVIKAGFIIGGRHGRGILSMRDKGKKWGNPIFISFTGASFGWQIGVQSIDIILVFKSAKSVDAIRGGKFTLGADASVAVGPVGRHAEAGTDWKLDAEIYSYSRSRGLFAGVALEGSNLSIDQDSNRAFYGKKNILIDHILNAKGITIPDSAIAFKKTLSGYAD